METRCPNCDWPTYKVGLDTRDMRYDYIHYNGAEKIYECTPQRRQVAKRTASEDTAKKDLPVKKK